MRRTISHIFIIIFVSLSFGTIHSQDKDDGKEFSVAVRGKVFAFFIIEDIFFATSTLGTELIYNGRHSIGVDVSFWRWRLEEEEPDAVALYDQFIKRTFLYFDYKLKFASIQDGQFYFNLYNKIGKYRMWYKEFENEQIAKDVGFLKSTSRGVFSELGTGIGVKKHFGENTNFGIDFSINFAKRFDKNDMVVYTTPNDFEELYGVKEQYFIPFLKLNIFYLFKKKPIANKS